MRDYLTVKSYKIPKLNKIYEEFKRYANDANIEELLADLLYESKQYQKLTMCQTGDPRLDICLKRLQRLEVTVARPLLLDILQRLDAKQLSLSDAQRLFEVIENYIFRRIICDLPTGLLNNMFAALPREVLTLAPTGEQYAQAFLYVLLNKPDRTRFPSDEEFTRALTEREIYKLQRRTVSYLLERLENASTREDKDIYRHLDAGDYSIEHIMPQTLNLQWRRDLGPNYAIIHTTWLHRIANLTLTAYNTEYSNRSFAEKKSCKHGFLDSGLRINQRIAANETWGQPELEARSRELKEQALQLWARPVTAFHPALREEEHYTLEDDIPLILRRQPWKFTYNGRTYPTKSWSQMYLHIVQLLHEKDSSILPHFVTSPSNDPFLKHFSYDQSQLRRPGEIERGLYVELNGSAEAIIKWLQQLFEQFGEEPSLCVYYLRTPKNSSKDTSPLPQI